MSESAKVSKQVSGGDVGVDECSFMVMRDSVPMYVVVCLCVYAF